MSVTDSSTVRGRALLGASVSVTYTVKVTGSSAQYSYVANALSASNSAYQIMNTLTYSNNGYAVTSVADANVVATPTAAPSAAPSAAPILPYTLPSSCFAGSETVTMESGELKAISSVRVGDRVLAANAAGKTVASPVVYVPHGANKESALFAHIATEKRDVKMTKNHILPAGVCGSTLSLVYASQVTVGDCIQTVDGQEKVSSVEVVQSEGVYTIVTNEEYVVVNGIIASPFGANHMMANMFYNIHRVVYALCPVLLASTLLHTANEGLGLLIPLFGASAKTY